MSADSLRVTMAPDGFYPASIRWQGRSMRVLYVEETFTCGLERRYRLRTPEGRVELGLDSLTAAWRMRRAPAWWERLWMRVLTLPRYPAPAGRRRGSRAVGTRAAPTARVAVPRPAPRPAPAIPVAR